MLRCFSLKCGVANNERMNEMKIMIKFIFRSDLTRTKQHVSLSLSKIINTKVAFLIIKEQRVCFNIKAFSVA